MITPPCELNKKVTRVNVTLKTNMWPYNQKKSCNELDNEKTNFEPKPSKVFVVSWSSLLMLLWQYLHPTYFLPATTKSFSLTCCQLSFSLQCSDNHAIFWRTQPDCNCFSVGNLMSAATVAFSTNTNHRVSSFSS